MTGGMRFLAEALEQESFPMSLHELYYAVGDIEVDDGQGGRIPIRDLADRFPPREFRNPEEVLLAIRAEIALRKGQAA